MNRLIILFSAFFMYVCFAASCDRTNNIESSPKLLSLSTDNPNLFTKQDIDNITEACNRINLKINGGVFVYDFDSSYKNLAISGNLFSFIVSNVDFANSYLVKASTNTKFGDDSTNVSPAPTNDCVIVALSNWGDYSYDVIECFAIDSCGYTPDNGIHIDNIPHLMDILYPESYLQYDTLPSNIYMQPTDMVAIMRYYDTTANIYRPHMVNVTQIMSGVIFYDGGAALISHCDYFLQKQ